jgi:hypothetical protein
MLPITPTAIVTATPVRPTPLPIPTLPGTKPAAAAGVTVQLQITERTWLRVIVDGQVSYMGSATPGRFCNTRATAYRSGLPMPSVSTPLSITRFGVLGARGQDRRSNVHGWWANPSPRPSPTDSGPARVTTPDCERRPRRRFRQLHFRPSGHDQCNAD